MKFLVVVINDAIHLLFYSEQVKILLEILFPLRLILNIHPNHKKLELMDYY